MREKIRPIPLVYCGLKNTSKENIITSTGVLLFEHCANTYVQVGIGS